ncbi:ankyrin repeat-containing protein At5g02620-like isoform X2 [Prunus avium]|uniref:Ankyrin repeat-containing protein At5g02620-like isoform X2 n=1 Tax=Prunus avium TaxID=42229 RepID=A0A6P5TRD6_PRUAV|nr:ankyrin repeat-containing protein At5g02620-like isoform X2 [Prunus avium]
MSSPGTQSTPASTEPKHPSRHLLEKSNRKAYLDLCVPLHKAAIKGDWDTAKGILTNNPTLLSASITKGWQTALHIAAGARHIHFVEELVKMMDKEDLALQDNKENTALSFAAGAGAIEIAEIMIQKNKLLPTIQTGKGLTPFFMAALLGRSEMACNLYRETYPTLNETNRKDLFFSFIDTGLYDLAIKMLEDDTTLATARNSNAETALHVLARRPLEFGGRSTSGMCSRLMNSFSGIEDTYKSLKQTKALELVDCLWDQILKHDDDDVMRLITEPSEVLFDATRLGNYEFLSVLINAYPDLLWETDDKNRTIFHVAVLYRHASIFNLVHETGSIKDIIVTYADHDDENNNILHLAAKLAPQNQLNLVSGAALQMQRELVWFEEVKKIVQPLSIDMKNKDGKTPRELFTSEHEELLRKGESWMKNTANSCMLVATIITTVVFAAAFSIPGGIADNTGAPKFLKDTAFLIFAISNGVSLFSSSTSMLMFLYILTSRYAENDFLKSLPLKLMVGLASLFISMTSMMIAFSTAFYLSCHGLGFVSDFIFILTFVPVVLFVFLQYPLLCDMFLSTYYSSLIFQPRKHMIQ